MGGPCHEQIRVIGQQASLQIACNLSAPIANPMDRVVKGSSELRQIGVEAVD